ncbi:hypothetical protein BDZ91DRAFT_830109 [Kalaharituber pfeilii]|nr:hypothetical protein BDZ91DRAFT_830109 [Kalaharituber pfeilii]
MSTQNGTEQVDLVVIGAGWHGLMAAKTYLEVNSSANILILDKSQTIGGVWAEHRLYPGLKTNNMLGTYEFSDFPMTGENAFGVKPGEHIPGHIVHAYLKKFAQEFGIYQRCRFSEEVQSAQKLDSEVEKGSAGGWLLNVHRTKKLVVATGLTSEPFLPTFSGAEKFEAPIIHCGDLLQHSENLFTTAKNVAIFGGTKSAWDAAYAFATRDIHVDWIIRESGHGPCWMAPPYLVTTRFLTWFSPCVWGEADGFKGVRNFLHGTAFGRAIVNEFWGVLASDVIELNQYDKHPETAKLKPWVDAFWVASGLSILNYPSNFFDLVKEGKITVHVGDVAQLCQKAVHISSIKDTSTTITADALLCSTGWKFAHPLSFLDSDGKALDPSFVGLPYRSEVPDNEDDLIAEADKEIFSRFPRLKNQPALNPSLKPLRESTDEDPNRPFTLYRFMIPPAFLKDRTLAFSGMLQTVCTPMVSQVQALWVAAYLNGGLQLGKDMEKANRETILHTRFGRWRYPGGYGARYPDFAFDTVPYVDLLLGDLGLSGRRKRGLLKECFESYGMGDYVGLVREWKVKKGMQEEDGEAQKKEEGHN